MKSLAVAVAVAVCNAASAQTPPMPPAFLGAGAWVCPAAGWITGFQRGEVNDKRMTAAGCLYGLDLPQMPGSRTRLAVLDTGEFPMVFVCVHVMYDKRLVGVSHDFMCGDTLAQWVVGVDRQPLGRANLDSLARGATMAQVRALPAISGQ